MHEAMKQPCDSRGTGLVVIALDSALEAQAAACAVELGCAWVTAPPGAWRDAAAGRPALLVDHSGLMLADGRERRGRPVAADLADRRLLYRLQHAGPRSEALGRALGGRRLAGLRVVDATAGWGRDSAVLGALGCEVVMLERHPVVRLLLADALSRALSHEDPLVRTVAGRLQLRGGDARMLLRDWPGPAPDAIVLDPMFPERDGSAAPRGYMRLFQELVGDDDDAAELLDAALSLAWHRVIVKRPLRAPGLPGLRPAHAVIGRSTRLDVYVLRGFGDRSAGDR